MSHGFAQELYRARTGTAQDLYRPCTAPLQGPHDSCTVLVPNLCCHDMSYVRNLHGNPYGPCTRSVQGPCRACTGPVQAPYRPCTGPVRIYTFLHQGLRPLSVNFLHRNLCISSIQVNTTAYLYLTYVLPSDEYAVYMCIGPTQRKLKQRYRTHG